MGSLLSQVELIHCKQHVLSDLQFEVEKQCDIKSHQSARGDNMFSQDVGYLAS